MLGEPMGPLTFNSLRLVVGSCLMMPAIWRQYRSSNPAADQLELSPLLVRKHKDDSATTSRSKHQPLCSPFGLLVVAASGVLMLAFSSLQQWGLTDISAGEAGFITGLYCIITPLLGHVLGIKTAPATWLAGIVSVGGLYLISTPDGEGIDTISIGAVHVMASAVLMAVGVLMTDFILARGFDPLLLTAAEHWIATILALLLAYGVEGNAGFLLVDTKLWEIVLCGSCEVLGYVLSAYGQVESPPAHAGLLMSLESPFALLAGFVFLREHISQRAGVGCALMSVAILLSQVQFFVADNVDEDERGDRHRKRRTSSHSFAPAIVAVHN
eukprot:gb/GEZN01010388.1/.p1 GENE.gb/GEZN01010388.1/~~gb/GEZN01010388.1/.p1  ORF type:complete len:376 (-),score=44.15 gb/GEZN01010388.1/:118-1098(-)